MRERPGVSPGRVRFPCGDPRPVPSLAHRVFRGPQFLGYLERLRPGGTRRFKSCRTGHPVCAQGDSCPQHFRRVVELGYRFRRRGRRFESGLRPTGWSSSVAEHVNSQFVPYPSMPGMGRSPWIIASCWFESNRRFPA